MIIKWIFTKSGSIDQIEVYTSYGQSNYASIDEKQLRIIVDEYNKMKKKIDYSNRAPEGALSIADNKGGELSIND